MTTLTGSNPFSYATCVRFGNLTWLPVPVSLALPEARSSRVMPGVSLVLPEARSSRVIPGVPEAPLPLLAPAPLPAGQ